MADLVGNALDGDADDVPGGDHVVSFEVVPLAAPGALAMDMDSIVGGRLNVDGPTSTSLGIDSVGLNGNSSLTPFAVRIGTDPGEGWLRFSDADGGFRADGNGPEWHAAGEWAGQRLLGLEPGMPYTFYAKARNGIGGESDLVEVGSYSTNADCDVNASDLVTAIDYAYIRAGILKGGELGDTLAWALDVTGDGAVSALDLSATQPRALDPGQSQGGGQAGGSMTDSRSAGAGAPLQVASPAIAHAQAILSRGSQRLGRDLILDRDGDGDVDRDDMIARQIDYADLGE